MKTTAKIIAGLLLIAQLATAQKSGSGSSDLYSNALGIRAGETSGITYKHHFGSGNAFEGIFSVWPYTFGITGLYEKYNGTKTPGLNWYYGGGGHLNSGAARYKAYYVYKGDYIYVRRSSEIAVGIDGILGLEYKFKPIPLAISADIKPYLESSNYGNLYMTMDPGIGIKLTF